jgi:hypothetical protein
VLYGDNVLPQVLQVAPGVILNSMDALLQTVLAMHEAEKQAAGDWSADPNFRPDTREWEAADACGNALHESLMRFMGALKPETARSTGFGMPTWLLEGVLMDKVDVQNILVFTSTSTLDTSLDEFLVK